MRDARDGAPADEAADRLTVDASQCGTSINGYCKSDAGTCQTPFGPPFATDWNSELAKACSTSGRVTVDNCGNYMVLTLGSVDTSVTLYYLRSTGALVSHRPELITGDYVCVAGDASTRRLSDGRRADVAVPARRRGRLIG